MTVEDEETMIPRKLGQVFQLRSTSGKVTHETMPNVNGNAKIWGQMIDDGLSAREAKSCALVINVAMLK